MRHNLNALLLLTATLVRRLLREGIVLRSLIFPVALTAGTLLITLGVLSYAHGPDAVAVTGAAADDAVLLEAFREHGWTPIKIDDPAEAIKAGRVFAGTDGTELWVDDLGRKELRLEALVRGPDAYWAPAPPNKQPRVDRSSVMGRILTRILGALFTLYGVVFGAGMVARDRDDGTLEAELALAVPRWIHGASRWLAGASVLTAFFLLSQVIFDSLLGVPDAAALARNGAASTATAVAVGLLVIGQAGLKQGFSGPLSLGLSVVTGLLMLGATVPEVGIYVPMASLMTDSDGWIPLALTSVVGALTVAGFTWRTASA
jgi:hypothetical protein